MMQLNKNEVEVKDGEDEEEEEERAEDLQEILLDGCCSVVCPNFQFFVHITNNCGKKEWKSY